METGTTAMRGRLLATLRLQYPDTCVDRGFRLLHPVTGDHYTDDRRHLVATCRSIANFATGVLVDGPKWCTVAAGHGLEFLRNAHRDDDGSYCLVVDADGKPIDRTRSAYGHAFVLLAHARTTAVSVDGARENLERTTDLLENRFVDSRGLLRSDCDPDWSEQEPYRGQNANMHACEAYLAAYEGTDEQRYLERARTIAYELTVQLAAETDGLLWEHYTADWEHDFGYNQNEQAHQFRPPGYQPGHHAEWAKFLALLDRYEATPAPRDGWYRRGAELFEAAIDLGWTGDGMRYTTKADGTPIVDDQYGWALAEAIGASAILAERAEAHDEPEAATGFREWHERLVACSDRFCGPAGLWYEKCTPLEERDELIAPDPPGVEPDYHPASAWFESWRSAERAADSR